MLDRINRIYWIFIPFTTFLMKVMKCNPLTRKGAYNVVRQDLQDLLDFILTQFPDETERESSQSCRSCQNSLFLPRRQMRASAFRPERQKTTILFIPLILSNS